MAQADHTDSRLLDPGALAEQGPPEAVRLPVSLVDPSDRNPRRSLAEVDQLAASIGDPKVGLLQPILVRRAGQRYEVLAGHRRLAAFQMLREQRPHEPQWLSIPSVVRSMDDDDTAFLALLEAQIHVRPFTHRELSGALERLMAGGRTLKEVGEVLHRTEGWASRRLRTYADAVLSAYVQLGQLPVGTADELLPVRDPETRRQLAERAVAEQWSQDQTRGQVRALRLDRQLADLPKRLRELVNILAVVDASKLPAKDIETLKSVYVRLGRLATGAPVVFPSLEAARQVAGVKTQAVRRRTRLRTE